MSASRYVRRLLGLFILLGACALLVVVYRYFNRTGLPGRQASSPASPVDLALKSIHYTEAVAGTMSWELFAASGDYSRAADLSTLHDLRFLVYRRGAGTVTVTSRRGEFHHAAKRVVLSDNVTAGGDGMTFDTSRIIYDTEKKTFSTTERVRLTDGRLTVEGVGMELDAGRQQARLFREVQATIYPAKSGK